MSSTAQKPILILLLITYLDPLGDDNHQIHCFAESQGSTCQVPLGNGGCGSSEAPAACPARYCTCSLGHIAALVWMIFRGTWGAPELGSNYTFATYLSYGTEKSPNSFDSQFSRLYSGYNNYPSLAWMPHGTCKIKKIYTVPNPALPEDS